MERWPCWSMTDAFGRAPPREEPGAKMSLEVFVRLLVPENSLGDLEQPAKFDQGGHASADRRLENLFADPTEAERAKPGLVGDAKQIVAFRERTNRAAFALGEAALSALHKAAAPGIRR